MIESSLFAFELAGGFRGCNHYYQLNDELSENDKKHAEMLADRCLKAKVPEKI